MIPFIFFILLGILLIIAGVAIMSEFSVKVGLTMLLIGIMSLVTLIIDKPQKILEVEGYYNINTVTNNGVIAQVCIIDDGSLNITSLFGKIFPEGTIMEKTIKSYKNGPIVDWLLSSEDGYECILPTDKKYNEILKEKD